MRKTLAITNQVPRLRALVDALEGEPRRRYEQRTAFLRQQIKAIDEELAANRAEFFKQVELICREEKLLAEGPLTPNTKIHYEPDLGVFILCDECSKGQDPLEALRRLLT